jgi:hypothetical protein
LIACKHWREAIGKLIILAASAWAVCVLSIYVALRVLGELTVRLPAVRWESPDILAAVLVLYVGTASAAWVVARRLARGT